MKSRNKLAVSTLALSAFLVGVPSMVMAQDRVDANGMPTTSSTPEEHAQTQDLNQGISDGNAAVDKDWEEF